MRFGLSVFLGDALRAQAEIDSDRDVIVDTANNFLKKQRRSNCIMIDGWQQQPLVIILYKYLR